MAIILLTKANWAAPLASAGDGDVCRFTEEGDYVGPGIDINLVKNLTVELATSVSWIAINLGAFGIVITAQAGGTTQTWKGPMTLTSTAVTADTGVIHGRCTNGNLTLKFHDVHTSGWDGVTRKRGSGIGATFDNWSFTIRVDCFRCDASNVANQGFFTSTDYSVRVNSTAYPLYRMMAPGTGRLGLFRCSTAGTSAASPPAWNFTPGTTTADGTAVWTCMSTALNDYCVMNLWRCSGHNNGEEGSSGHTATQINDYSPDYFDVGEFPNLNGTMSTQNCFGGRLRAGASFGNVDGQGFANVGDGTFQRFEDCDMALAPGLGANHAFRAANHAGVTPTLTLKRCRVAISANVGLLNVAGPCTILFEDCVIVMTGDYRNLGSQAIVILTTAAGASVTFRRCRFDLSGCVASGTANRQGFALNGRADGSSSLNFEACEFVCFLDAFWVSANQYFMSYSAGAVGNVIDCTFYGHGQTFLDALNVNGATPTVVVDRNLFSGWRRHVLYLTAASVHDCRACLFGNNPAPTGAVYLYDGASGAITVPAHPSEDAAKNTRGIPGFVSAVAPLDLRLTAGTPGVGRDAANAGYKIEPFKLRLKPSGGGTLARVAAEGGTFAAPNDAGCWLDAARQVNVTPTPAPDAFVRWDDGASGTANPLAVTLDRNQSVTGVFATVVRRTSAGGATRGRRRLRLSGSGN